MTHPLLRERNFTLSQLAALTAFLCVFVVPAVMALSMIVRSPLDGLVK